MYSKLRYLKISPRKVRLVVDMIRNKNVVESIKILNFTVKKAKEPLLKLLNSAVANSKNMNFDPAELYIKEIRVDKGPTLKRHMPRSKGMSNPIMKRTSHIIIILDKIEKRESKKNKRKIIKKEINKLKDKIQTNN